MTLDASTHEAGGKIHFIRPGEPVENGNIETFNGKFRDQYLNSHEFLVLYDAEAKPKPGVVTTARFDRSGRLATSP